MSYRRLLARPIYRGTTPRRFVRQCLWCYRHIYRVAGYGRWRSLRCAVLLNALPIVARWRASR